MRTTVSNRKDDFHIKGYAGTNSVLLAMNLSESRKPNLMGFAIEKNEGGNQWSWLLSSLTFPGKQHTLPEWNATPSNLSPIQKFRWGDYSIDPGITCRYRIHLVYGSDLNLDEMLEVELKTDDGKPKNHHVNFNRAVAASQAFGRQFEEVIKLIKDKKKADKNLSIEDWPLKPREWLENGLLDAILNFIDSAKNEHWALDVAIYEYELKAIVDAINAAFKRKVEVRVLYHAKKNDEQTIQNENSLANLPAANKKSRVTNKIFHDKFIVLSKLDAAKNRIPQAVLCGSTNFTENGVYRQANVVHIVEEKSTADCYEDVFNMLWDHPEDVSFARAWITDQNPMDEGQALFAGFSPRKDKTDLDEFIKIIKAADKDVLFATAFRLPEDILDALLGKDHDSVLRFGIQNSTSRITGYHADRSADFSTPALYSSGLDGWVKEGLHGQRGHLLVHTKTVVTNFTTNHPVIISGSHNLSSPASYDNDENYLIIRDNPDLADRYGLEILRFYEHYRARYYARELKLEKVRPLAEDDSWANPYYETGNLKKLARLRFAGN